MCGDEYRFGRRKIWFFILVLIRIGYIVCLNNLNFLNCSCIIINIYFIVVYDLKMFYNR